MLYIKKKIFKLKSVLCIILLLISYILATAIQLQPLVWEYVKIVLAGMRAGHTALSSPRSNQWGVLLLKHRVPVLA